MKTLNLDSSVINEKKRKPPKQEAPAEKENPVPPTSNTPPGSPEKNDPFIKRLSLKVKQLIEKFKSLTPVQKLLVTLVICGVIVGTGALVSYLIVLQEGKAETFTIPDMIRAQPATGVYAADIPVSKPNPPRDTPNPINGELFTKAEFEEFSSRYPIAVMIENHVDARPQSGYNSADLVFETLAEGGITRTMAIFWSRSSSEIGPVRSARQYYLEWLMPFDPLYMHIGQAYSDDPRVDANGNIYKYNIKSLDVYGAFWRVQDRFSPHNAYTSTDLMYQKAEQYGYTGSPEPITSWKFKADAPLDQRGSNTTATLLFFEQLNNNGLYDVTWSYDKNRNVYLRSNNGTEYTDATTDEQVFAKNVIIQRVNVALAFDDKAHLIITTIGEGDAIILRDGRVIYGTWKKSSLEERTKYYDTDGEEIVFNRGITWVEAVPIDQGNVQIDS
jgi:hypothetical protein